MRIAYLVNQYPMPSQTFIRREIRALEKLGHHVGRFAMRDWPGRLTDDEDRREAQLTRYITALGPVRLLVALFFCVLRMPKRFFSAVRLSIKVAHRSDRSKVRHFAYLAEACVLQRWLAHANVEHLHVHFGTNSAEVAMLCRVLGGPEYSFTVHGPEEFDRAACMSFDEKAAHAKFVVAISNYARSQLFRWIRYEDWNKIKIVHCGLDERYLRFPITPPTTDRRLVCVGRLCEQKGHLVLLQAAAKCAASAEEPFELVLIGDGELRPQLEKQISELALQRVVKLYGWASGEEVRHQLNHARALVLPSFAEGLPVVIMESLAIGRPVISTWIAGIPELLKHGENGWVIPAGDVDELANRMQEVLSLSSERLSVMSRAAADSVRERHDITKEVAKLSRLFAGEELAGVCPSFSIPASSLVPAGSFAH